jgi:2'-5' RNA ligase
MGQMAVDVVLLPDEAMMSRAIQINRQLLGSGCPEMVLNQQDCLPHISLAMGCMDEADAEAIRQRLAELARRTAVRELSVVEVVGSTNVRGETTSVLQVEKTGELQSLHERVMTEMSPFFRYEVSAAMIHDDGVAPSTLDWIRTYPQKAGYECFSPHITIGYGRVPPGLCFPIPFTVTRLALCHLGNHCTCRKVLAAAEIALE